MILCRKCNREKSDDCFSWKHKQSNKRHNICKLCKRDIDNELYKSSFERRKLIRERAKRDFKLLNNYVQRLKKFGWCKNCGDKRWYVLDFHHLKGKENSIPAIIRQGSIKRLKNEIKKCVLLCSNCHREHHFFERENNKRLWVGFPSFIW